MYFSSDLLNKFRLNFQRLIRELYLYCIKIDYSIEYEKLT